ncbi:MAG: phosphatase PAP2 family protein [Candidatus Nanoarchaeia archaeon]
MDIDATVNSLFFTNHLLIKEVFLVISYSLFVLLFFFFALQLIKFKKEKDLKYLNSGAWIVFLIIFFELLKFFSGRERPNGNPGSFPSNHAGLSFFISYLWPTKNKLLKSGLFIWAVLISLSRLVLNLHWFTDVLAGSILGLLFAFLTEKININKILKFVKKK